MLLLWLNLYKVHSIFVMYLSVVKYHTTLDPVTDRDTNYICIIFITNKYFNFLIPINPTPTFHYYFQVLLSGAHYVPLICLTLAHPYTCYIVFYRSQLSPSTRPSFQIDRSQRMQQMVSRHCHRSLYFDRTWIRTYACLILIRLCTETSLPHAIR